LIFSCKPWQQ